MRRGPSPRVSSVRRGRDARKRVAALVEFLNMMQWEMPQLAGIKTAGNLERGGERSRHDATLPRKNRTSPYALQGALVGILETVWSLWRDCGSRSLLT